MTVRDLMEMLKQSDAGARVMVEVGGPLLRELQTVRSMSGQRRRPDVLRVVVLEAE